MEQIYNAMMASVQAPAERPSSANKSDKSDSFQKLMDQKQNGSTSANQQQDAAETPVQSQPQTQPQEDGASQETVEAGTPASQDIKELEKQMALAAALMLQNPLVADIAEETPQVLSDPSWEEGLVPVGFDDSGDYRIVHWMQPEAAEQNLDALNDEAVEVLDAYVDVEAEAEVEAPVMELDTGAPVAEVRTEAVEVQTENAGEGEEQPELQDAEVEAPVFGEVEAAPVKVGEAPVQEEASQTEDIGNQVGPWMARLTGNMAEGDKRTIVVQLEPENLGKIQLEMTMTKDGSLHITLNAENSRTQGLLSRNSDGLAALLGKYSQNDVQVEVPHQEESQRQDLYDQQRQQQQQQQQQERHQSRHRSGEDFLQQMRLGLIPIDEE